MTNEDRLTHSDIEEIKELFEEGLTAEEIVPEMDHKDYIDTVCVEYVIKHHCS